jgi:hypothetical protein
MSYRDDRKYETRWVPATMPNELLRRDDAHFGSDAVLGCLDCDRSAENCCLKRRVLFGVS